jgi:hypothetical protein
VPPAEEARWATPPSWGGDTGEPSGRDRGVPLRSIGPDAARVGTVVEDLEGQRPLLDGLEMTFVSAHRPLSVYADSLADAGLLIERLGEPAPPEHATETGRSTRVPLFLHIRALKP